MNGLHICEEYPRGCKGCKFLFREVVAENTEAHSMKQEKVG
jgi:hypothetical protein